MDFKNLTKEDKRNITDGINSHYGINIITEVCSVIENNTTLIIYQDPEKTNAIHIDHSEFRAIMNQLLLGA